MGASLDEDKSQKAAQYETSIYGYGACYVTRLVRPWLFFDPIFVMTKTFWKQRKHVESLHSFADMVIKERRNYVKETGGNILDVRNVKITKRRLALLDRMLAAEGEGLIDDEGIKEEVNTFMFEGHDTTAMALCFILLLLANNRNDQDKAYEEIMEVLGNGPLTFESLGHLPYLEACLKGGLRLYPSVPFIMRELTEDVQLSQKFAMMQLKSVVVAILKNFILEAVTKPDDLILTADIVLRARDPIYVKFVSRNKK